jgi:hypothetical protein
LKNITKSNTKKIAFCNLLSTMRVKKVINYLFVIPALSACSKGEPYHLPANPDAVFVDHLTISLSSIPSDWIANARKGLHIAYSHTSHGSRLTDGITGLVSFRGTEYSWNNGGKNGALDLHDYAMPCDLGSPDLTAWAPETRTSLDQNPDGIYFGDKKANEACGYDSNGDGNTERNWAIEWQNTHTEGVDWFVCGSEHTQPVNANMKACAARWLWARLAGWEGI